MIDEERAVSWLSSTDLAVVDRGLTPTGAIYAIFGFLAFVAFVPAWVWWIDNNTAALSFEATFLATLILPATVLLYLTGWLQGSSQ